MAKLSMALAELVEKGAQDDVVRELLGHVAERLMEFEVEQRTGAEYGARSTDRSNSRNGYRDRLWETRAGSIDLRISQASSRNLFPSVSRASPNRREGARCGYSRSVHPRRFDAIR